MPFISIASKLANRPDILEILEKNNNSSYLTDKVLFLIDIFPSTHGSLYHLSGIEYYLKWSAYNFFCILLLIFFKKKIINFLEKVKEFYDGYNVILFSVIFIVLTYQSKLFLGFWFAGIVGWDESHIKSQLKPVSKPLVKNNAEISKSLLLGIDIENFNLFFEEGCLPGQVILGYADGKIVAINNGISGIVFDYRFVNDQNSNWLNIINHRQNKNYKQYLASPFLFGLIYPEHATYTKLENKPLMDIMSFDSISV